MTHGFHLFFNVELKPLAEEPSGDYEHGLPRHESNPYEEEGGGG